MNFRWNLLWIGATMLISACQNNASESTTQNNETEKEALPTTLITLSGQSQKPEKGRLILKKFEEGQFMPLDTLVLNGKSFKLEVPVSEADFYLLDVFGQAEFPLVLNPAQPLVRLELSSQAGKPNLQVKDSKDTQHYEDLQLIINEFGQKLKDLEAKYPEPGAAMQEEYQQIQEKSVADIKKLIEAIGPSIVALRAASVLDPETEFEYLEALSQKMKKKLPNSRYTQQLEQKVQVLAEQRQATAHLAVGKPAPEINLLDPNGQNINLSSLQGKLVLIDFWASWCVPCRRENPNVVKVYDRYKNQGFEIYGVSLDRNREAWLKAIAEDQLTWLHVFDGSSQAAQTYAVQAIPATFLIGKDGKILAKNLRGAALEAKIAEVLAKG
ncbi:MAG: AhpC/TSA family protein [Microscillaceae bacterium]|nr:AhpC/TSA family protein [Microscillaceae bacterium]